MVLLISFPAALGRELDRALSGSPDPPDSIARVKSLRLTSKDSINAPRNGASERNTRYIQSSHALERVFCAGSSRDMAGEIAGRISLCSAGLVKPAGGFFCTAVV